MFLTASTAQAQGLPNQYPDSLQIKALHAQVSAIPEKGGLL